MSKVSWDSTIIGHEWASGKTVRELERYGCCNFGGETYVCLYPVEYDDSIDGDYYFAPAVRIGDEITDGKALAYQISWFAENGVRKDEPNSVLEVGTVGMSA